VKILFLVTEDWYFWSHALKLARTLRDAGAEVVVMTRLGALRDPIEDEGFRVIPWRVVRKSLNPFREGLAFAEVVRAYHDERPDLVHHAALKPIVYGGIAARLCGGIPSVNVVVGLGYVFASQTTKMALVRRLVMRLLQIALRPTSAKTIFQNDDNRKELVKWGIVNAERALTIRGDGVDKHYFRPTPEPVGTPVVMMASRMLWEKGVADFVRAAEMVHEEGLPARFVLVGKPDPQNPGSIDESQLNAWCANGSVEWWGSRDDMPDVIGQSNIICLPSFYGEGVPRALVEAAACGRAIVTTDMPGCRDVVRQGDNGILVPIHNPRMVADAVKKLIENPPLRAHMALRGRDLILDEFSQDTVVSQMMGVYSHLLGDSWPALASDSSEGSAERPSTLRN